jgi:TPR repeat protein
MYNEGHGVKQSDSKALSLYQMACENGDLNGCMNLNTLKREVEE